jgi:hypothetical protein
MFQANMSDIFKYSNQELFEEVHPSQNNNIDFDKLRNNSGKKIWWQCRKNEKHIWQQSITARVKQGYGCPYCSGLKTIAEESLGTLYPDIAKEVHPIRNGDFDSFKTAPKSNKNIWWLCSEGHVWQARICMRTNRKQSCPECRLIENSVEKKYPDLTKEWHPTKNLPLTPDKVRPSKNIDIWWQCLKILHMSGNQN